MDDTLESRPVQCADRFPYRLAWAKQAPWTLWRGGCNDRSPARYLCPSGGGARQLAVLAGAALLGCLALGTDGAMKRSRHPGRKALLLGGATVSLRRRY